ncbi:MAG: hypothetical protein RBS38_06845 [Bacteroidales bacterium]|jgi:hypothetical protein|nr:hypothetical protein [Bacteroidales bacterium]
MKDTISKTKRSRHYAKLVPVEIKKTISEEAIRNRAFEIYQENPDSSFNEKDNWCYAERELNGYYK